MTDEERTRLASELAHEANERTQFIRMSTALTALLPIAYGVLALVFGDSLWNIGVASPPPVPGVGEAPPSSTVGSAVVSPIYEAAQSVPGAPESWGVVMLVLGLAILALLPFPTRTRWMAVAAGLTSVVFLFFSASFLADAIDHDAAPGLTGALVYFVFAAQTWNRARLAWKA